ncbi:AT-rich interactive domain-containing protein 2 [Podochytrium sp. JEL0797]|nr:AT-rich interactive domain-containing protein 2 [Podochytrium sp. JEL0797]
MRFKDGDDGIERTPQYYEFMQELQDFHGEVGTSLQHEGILGGKKLDLYRIYLGVKRAGGFEKVSEEHGWQKVANPFDFPPTCTNSAYVIKKAYKLNLYNYAQVKDYGVPIEQIKVMESAARKINEEAASGAATATGPKKSNKERSQFTNAMAVATTYVAPQRGNGAPIKVEEFARDERYLLGGSQNKLLLALQSGLPNEVDWAFNKLVRLSSTSPPNFHIGSIAGLLDAILTHADPFFDNLKLNTAMDNFETSPDYSRPPHLLQMLPNYSELSLFNNHASAQMMDRVLQIMHILRNLSFTDNHIKFFISQHAVLTIVAKALALPSYSLYLSLKLHSLDIFDNLSHSIALRGRNDFYLACLRKTLTESTDRAFLLGAVRSLTKLCGTDANHAHLCDLDPPVLARAFQLLRVAKDEEMVYTVLEFLYCYSCLGADAVVKVVEAAEPGNVVAVLMGFLQLKPVETSVAAAAPKAKRRKVAAGSGGGKAGAAGGGVVPPNAQPLMTVPTPMMFQKPAPKQPVTGQSTPVSTAASSNVSSPAPVKLKAAPPPPATPAPAPVKKSRVTIEEDSDAEIDIDGDDSDDEVLASGSTPAAVHPTLPPPTKSTPAPPSFLDMYNPSAASATPGAKKRGRPPKHKAEVDSYSAQLAQQMQQQQMLMMQQNPNMNLQEQQNMMAMLQQQHAGMVSAFTASKAAGGAGAAAAVAVEEEEEEEEEVKEPEFECRWKEEGAKSECPFKFGTEVELLQHLADKHFPTTLTAFSCKWGGNCVGTSATTRAAVFHHVRTHIGDSNLPSAAPLRPIVSKPFKSNNVGGDNGGPDLVGIPLTALLVMRNVARWSTKRRELFLPWEGELVVAMAERPKVTKMIAEMMYELR